MLHKPHSRDRSEAEKGLGGKNLDSKQKLVSQRESPRRTKMCAFGG